MRVDIHAHFTPPAYPAAMERIGPLDGIDAFAVYGRGLSADPAGSYAGGDGAHLDRRLAEMDAASVDLTILGLGAVHPAFPRATAAAVAARTANAMLAGAVDHDPSRFRAFATLPLPHPAAAVRELEQVLADPRFAGIGVGCSAAGVPLDDVRLAPVWERLDAAGAILYLHPGSAARMGAGGADFGLPPSFGGPAEVAFALGRLIATGTTTRYPRVRIAAAVLGGSMAFYAHRFETMLRKSHPERVDELGGVLPHLRRMWFDTSVGEEPLALAAAREVYGVDRIVFGSDAPARTLSAAVAYVAESPWLDAAEKTAVLDVNAERLLVGAIR